MLTQFTVVITLIKLKPKKREEEVSFDQPPTLQHINASVESLFDECKREDFELRCGKERIDSEGTLQILCSRSRAFTIAVSLEVELLHIMHQLLHESLVLHDIGLRIA
jgi:hypothetical protein